MHSLFSSSGIAQYHVNGLLRELVRQGISIDELDEWCSNVKNPDSYVDKQFFHFRFRDEEGEHFRGFANDCIMAVTLLGIFIDVVVKGTRRAVAIARRLHCFDLLRSMVSMLQSKSALVKDTLHAATQEHHIAFLALYIQSAKQKFHYTSHLGDGFRGKVSTCFTTEATHTLSKQIMLKAYKESLHVATSCDIHRM